MKKPDKKNKRDFLVVDMKGLRAQYVDYCKKRGLKPGPTIRESISKQLSKESVTESDRAIIPKPDKSRHGLFIRLTNSEHDTLNSEAAKYNLSVNQYIIRLCRYHLTKKPQFSSSEIDALAESNIQLLALGRNLNQIARALNAEDPDEHRPTVKEIKNLSDKIYQHTHEVSNLIRANLERWKIE